jgi:tetratricopeptide (TPR) repeat protein
MFGYWDNYNEESETLDVLKRYHNMIIKRNHSFFDLYEYECIIDFFTEQYNYKDALDAVCHAIRQHPKASSMKLRYAQLLIETGRPGKALGIIKVIGDIEFQNFELYLAKGIALNITGKHKEAETSFEKALKLCADGKDEVAYEIAQSFMQLEMNSLAIKYLLLANHFNPDNILAVYDLAMNYEKLDKPQKSIFYYQKYLDLDPFAEHVWSNLGLIYSDLGNISKAEESFDYAIAIDPHYIPAYFYKAEMLAMNDNLCKAVKVYTELLAEDSSNTKAMCEMGYCYQQIGNFSEALKVYRHVLEVNRDCAEAWFGIGSIYLRQRKYLLSISMIKKATSIQPANADYWFLLGKVYSSAHKFNKAIIAYTTASELNPYDYDTWMTCAQLLFRKKRILEATLMLTQLHQYNRNDSLINYRLAAYHAYQGELSMAQYYLKQGLAINYQEYANMFRQFPKTQSINVFRQIIDHHPHHELLRKNSN